MSLPKTVAVPLVGWMSPSRVLMDVDLPAPFGPMNPHSGQGPIGVLAFRP